MSLPRQYGGLNFSMVPYVMAAELVSRADAGFANIWGLQDCAETIAEFASDDIKAEFLPRVCYCISILPLYRLFLDNGDEFFFLVYKLLC